MAIELLKKEISEKIAAGEVVERPASVVKELVENSIDAGSSDIEIELVQNGLRSIRITDNGSGIAKDQVKKAFLRHATSKVKTADDLDRIGTLGFRGEALAAIAAVSRTRVITRTRDNDFAVSYMIEGGEEVSFSDAGGDVGTSIIVSDLFYNTPARMKFLKKDTSEGNAVQQIAEQLALSNPEISFRLIRDGKRVLSTPGNGDLYSAIYSVFPKDLSENLFGVHNYSDNIVTVSGFCGKPEVSRKSRGFQYSFLNGRYVKSSTITAAVEQAFRNYQMAGHFPVYLLNVTLPFEDVDVNVHPTKTEVRFKDDKMVFQSVYHSVSNALSSSSTYSQHIPTQKTFSSLPEESVVTEIPPEPLQTSFLASPNDGAEHPKSFLSLSLDNKNEDGNQMLRSPSDSFTSVDKRGVVTEEATLKTRKIDLDIDPKPISKSVGFTNSVFLRVIGELFETYILCEAGPAFLVIDKHAAHERILFEEIRNRKLRSEKQVLLIPEIVTVTAEEKSILLESIEQLDSAGFIIDEFGSNEIAIREAPLYFTGKKSAGALQEIAAMLLKGSVSPEPEEKLWLLHSISCRAAIKAGHKTSIQEMTMLAEKLLSGSLPAYCPHGRPIYWQLTKKEIEKQFGRIQ